MKKSNPEETPQFKDHHSLEGLKQHLGGKKRTIRQGTVGQMPEEGYSVFKEHGFF